ncbi:MAG: type II toxin-antitoxin system RatA family toxin [Pseudomonadota bacterium]
MPITSIRRSALLPYSAQQMYELVNDVEAYPQFMDGCKASRIVRSDEWQMEAELELEKGGFSHSFTTLNTLRPYERVELALKDGPFEHLSGAWQFTSLREDACKVSLDLEFAVRSGLLSSAAGTLFERVASRLVDAIAVRAEAIYRP